VPAGAASGDENARRGLHQYAILLPWHFPVVALDIFGDLS
jgi:hypothetical protein